MSVKKPITTLTIEQVATALNMQVNALKLMLNTNPHLQVEYEETTPVVRTSGVMAYLYTKKNEALKKAYDQTRQAAMDQLSQCWEQATSAETLVQALKEYKI